MAESFFKVIRVRTSIENAFQICKKICDGSKMEVKKSSMTATSFSLSAAERINWLSTSWPVKIDINATAITNDVVIEITSNSTFGSLTQGNANACKLNNFIESIIALCSGHIAESDEITSSIDRDNSFQVHFPRNVVFAYASAALKTNNMFKIREINPVIHAITLSIGSGLFSPGENYTINIKEKSNDTTEIIILSASPGTMTGATMNTKKNSDVEAITKCISSALQNITHDSMEQQVAPTEPPSPDAPSVVTTPSSFIFVCPFCGANLECPIELENTACKCPQCNQEISPFRNCDSM